MSEEKDSSLTSRLDRHREGPLSWRPDLNIPPLTAEEAREAVSDLTVNLTRNYPKIDRHYADPVYRDQLYCLVSFVPAKGAKPDDDGLYGMMKVRGVFPTVEEADQRSQYLIRNCDSYHKILMPYVGRPFPVTDSSRYSAEISEVDLRKKITETISTNVKEKRDEEMRTMRDLKEREEKLLAESKEEKQDPMEYYTTLQVKRAQLSWSYHETQKKLEEMKNIILKTREELQMMDEEHPEFHKQYYDKYMKARREAGIPDDKSEDNFMKFLVTDVDLGF